MTSIRKRAPQASTPKVCYVMQRNVTFPRKNTLQQTSSDRILFILEGVTQKLGLNLQKIEEDSSIRDE